MIRWEFKTLFCGIFLRLFLLVPLFRAPTRPLLQIFQMLYYPRIAFFELEVVRAIVLPVAHLHEQSECTKHLIYVSYSKRKQGTFFMVSDNV